MLQKTLRHDASEKKILIQDVRGEGEVRVNGRQSLSPQKPSGVVSKRASPRMVTAGIVASKSRLSPAAGSLYSKSPQKRREGSLPSKPREGRLVDEFGRTQAKTAMRKPIGGKGMLEGKRGSVQPAGGCKRRKTHLSIDLAKLHHKSSECNALASGRLRTEEKPTDKRHMLFEKFCKSGDKEPLRRSTNAKLPEPASAPFVSKDRQMKFRQGKFGSVSSSSNVIPAKFAVAAATKARRDPRMEKTKAGGQHLAGEGHGRKETAQRSARREQRDGLNMNYLKLAEKLAEELSLPEKDKRLSAVKHRASNSKI